MDYVGLHQLYQFVNKSFLRLVLLVHVHLTPQSVSPPSIRMDYRSEKRIYALEIANSRPRCRRGKTRTLRDQHENIEVDGHQEIGDNLVDHVGE